MDSKNGPISGEANTAQDTPDGGRRAADTRRRERTRRRLLDVAFTLIGHDRGRSLRIEEICAEARISRGSFYNYFASIEALFGALAYDLTHDFTLAVVAEMARMGSAGEKADVAMRHYLDRATRDPQWGWAMVNIGATGPLFGAETHASALKTVSEGIAAGEFLLSDARVGRDMVLGTCHAALITQLREGSAATQPRMISRAVLRGLGVPAERIELIVTRPLRQLDIG